MMDFLQQLNEKQRQAATAPKEPLMVLAGPGTGKTRTLIARILYLIHAYQIPPHKIIAVTFTNKAKEEMRHRLREELGDRANDVRIGTFHHYCLDTLREYYQQAQLPKQFTIADEMTQLMILSRAAHIVDERSLHTVLNAISSYRLNSSSLNPTLQGIAVKWLQPYHRELMKNRMIDFDQILLIARDLFQKFPEITEQQQQRFEAILVDEFQDTDPVQYEIMRLLAWQHRNIFAVADDDQSIFAWRGAHIGNINRFVEEFACQDRVIVLNENYRSAQCIIDIATQLLQAHRFIAKEIVAAGEAGNGQVPANREFLAFADDEAETQFILEQIQALTQPHQPTEQEYEEVLETPLRYADIAILYPNHAIGEYFESRLLAARIPCQLVKRQGVFDQEDVKKILLLLKLLQNPEDDVTLEQYVELELNNPLIFEQIKAWKSPRRSFKQTLLQGMRYENLSGMSKGQFRKTISTYFGVISNLLSYIDNNPTSSLTDLINMICNLTQPAHSFSIHSYVHFMLDPCDIAGMPETVEKVRTMLASNEGTLYMIEGDPDVARICTSLLQKALPMFQERISTLPLFRNTTVKFNPTISPRLRSVSGKSDVESRRPDVERSRDDISEADLFLCLDQPSAQSLRQAFPEIVQKQLIVMESINESPSIIQDVQGTLFSAFSSPVTVFKLLQAFSTADARKPFRDYVVIDLETTSGDTRTTRIVEIGAVKVRDGNIVATFGALVNPEQPITQGAYQVHGISDDDVRNQKTFKELLPELLEFLGNDMLVAHNGFDFDFPILLRLYRETTGSLLPNRRFDTLPLARRLFPGQPASVDALMQRFQIQDTGNRHRALDDTLFLVPIFERLQEVEQSVNRRSEHEELLELVALGLFLENPDRLSSLQESTSCTPEAVWREERLLFQLGARKLLSRFSELPEAFQPILAQYQSAIETLTNQLLSDQEEANADHYFFSGRDVSIARLKELAGTFKTNAIHEAISQFLDHATLYTSQDDLRDVNAVNLLTIHSAKGLEFPVVFVAGVEKGNLPSFYSVREEGELREKKLDEQRRLFYVAMTRAKQKLFVTYVNKRGEFPKKRSQFLIELGIETQEELDDH
ncbi:ATP-dependent DNA helicase PcrA [Candidatus Vecturithrix granuli]|uniref:DNA 3'-5' helicase n=1 Tax=Vecturithrix granuli TaxID=1499967 RepID=A0A081BX12_VECG1|nr:ATP-dependent DNA helicase PcrA [Candidatus Vecturithrix granuli]